MKLTLNSIFLGALLAISTFYSNTSHADGFKLTACHGCDAENTKSAALNAYEITQNGISYVVDKKNNSFRKYTVYTEWTNTGDHNVPVRRGIERTLTSLEQEASTELLEGIGELYSGKQYRKSHSGGLIADIVIANDPNGDSAYDFIKTSKMRSDLYQLHLATKVNAFSVVVNSITSKLSLGSIHLKDIKLGIKLIFNDDSLLTVIPNPQTETYDIVANSARESDGNTIPLSKAVVNGNYIFSSKENTQSFSQYLGYWGITLQWEHSCIPVTVSCVEREGGGLICLGSCM